MIGFCPPLTSNYLAGKIHRQLPAFGLGRLGGADRERGEIIPGSESETEGNKDGRRPPLSESIWACIGLLPDPGHGLGGNTVYGLSSMLV